MSEIKGQICKYIDIMYTNDTSILKCLYNEIYKSQDKTWKDHEWVKMDKSPEFIQSRIRFELKEIYRTNEYWPKDDTSVISYLLCTKRKDVILLVVVRPESKIRGIRKRIEYQYPSNKWLEDNDVSTEAQKELDELWNHIVESLSEK